MSSSGPSPASPHPTLKHDEPPQEVSEPDDDGSSSSSGSTQAGVKKVEAVSRTWTRTSLIFAYVGIFLMAFSTSLESQTVASLSVYATSAFAKHSLISVVLVVQGIVNAVIKPPMAKIADVFGRLESFSIAIFLYMLGYIQMAASSNVQTYAAAQIFYSAGATGLQILQQIFIADTSNLLNRALWSSLPDLPFLATVWAGPAVAQSILSHASWRWGYGLWAIVLPIAFLPLALSLFLNARKAARLGLLPPSPWEGKGTIPFLKKSIWFDLDLMGLLLLSAALALILIPLNLAATAREKWRNASIIAMLVIGLICAAIFPFWESNKRLAPTPFLSLRLLKNRTVLAGCGIAFFYFMAFYLSVQPYFNSYLQVVQNASITSAGHITQTFSFASTLSSIGTSLIIKYTAHYKYLVLTGCALYTLALGLMLRYRTQSASISQILATQILLGLGGGMLNVPTQLGVQASAPTHQDLAAATAIFLTVLEVGGAVGSAISGAIWSSQIPAKLALYLPEGSRADAPAIFASLATAQSYKPGTPEREAIDRAYQETMHTLLIVALCVTAPLMPLAALMRNYKLDEMEQHVAGTVMGGSAVGPQEGRRRRRRAGDGQVGLTEEEESEGEGEGDTTRPSTRGME